MRPRREAGATMVIFALVSVFLLTLVAFAVDLGRARFSSRDNQQIVDLAGVAAGYFLAGNGAPGGVAEIEPRAACEAALYSIWTNAEDFWSDLDDASVRVAATVACASFPPTSVGCSATTSPVYLTPLTLTSGPYSLQLQWPVAPDDIRDARFSGGIGVNDGDDQCERMRISIDKEEDTTFAHIIGVDTISSEGDAVVRGGPTIPTEGIAALLMLEREGCATLQASGQGSLIVQSITYTDREGKTVEQPGIVQSDSAGSTTFVGPLQCTTNENANGYAIFGTRLPEAVGGGPSIVAESAGDGTLGIIATYARGVGGRDAAVYPGGLNVEPTESGITSRVPADDRFNPAERPAITNLHTTGWTLTVSEGSLTTPSDTVLTDCSPADGASFPQTGTLVFACGSAGGFTVQNNRTVDIPNATTLKFIGGLNVGGGASFSANAAQNIIIGRSSATGNARLVVDGVASLPFANGIYVGGTPATCTQANNCSAVQVTGDLRINHENDSSCPSSTSAYGVLATFGGIIDISGAVTWCKTFVYVGDSLPGYARNERTVGGLNCTPEQPCPILTTGDSRTRFSLNGGGSSIFWSAPDQTEQPPDASNPFEGLALWVEGTGTSQIKGTGGLVTTGVFFLPNATFEFQGQAAADNPREAQFFARTLNFSGQGDLNLTPDPNDAVPTPIPGSFSLIR